MITPRPVPIKRKRKFPAPQGAELRLEDPNLIKRQQIQLAFDQAMRPRTVLEPIQRIPGSVPYLKALQAMANQARVKRAFQLGRNPQQVVQGSFITPKLVSRVQPTPLTADEKMFKDEQERMMRYFTGKKY